jgi:integrase
MARRVRDKALDSREGRGKLKPRGKPYWRTIERGLHLGYRRLKGKAGTWWARHYVGQQEYETESIGVADDLSDADGVAILDYWQAQTAARERMVNRAHAAAGKTGPLTVTDAVEQYLEWLESNRKSVYDVRRRAEAFIIPRLGDVECSALTADVVRAWHSKLAKEPPRIRTPKGLQPRHRVLDAGDTEARRRRCVSANRVLTILKAALNRAWREGKIPSDAQWRRVKPFGDVTVARVRYLSVAEAKRLINACDGEFRSLTRAALATGARYGELTRLQVHDFNRDAGTIAIRQSKSGKARHVVLTQEGATFFERLTAGRGGHEVLLPRADGNAFTKSNQSHRMIAACARAKITPPVGFHQLRHTWASLAVMNGVPLLIVAKNLGHSDTRMVEKHYGHLAPSYIVEAIRKGAPTFGLSKADSKVRSFESGPRKAGVI